ncbi:MAG: AAA family ATPase, partial [Candidatus Atribacteria bacterium]|nr:AAA family ATPase [Candidatus Atribacteria bacterium]
VNLEQLSKITDKYTGAEIEAIARRASMLAIREFLNKLKGKPTKKDIEKFSIKNKHFEEAMKLITSRR